MGSKPKGIIIPVVTAFTSDGKFDMKSQDNITEFLSNAGIGGIFRLGYTGEYIDMTNELRREIIADAGKSVQGTGIKTIICINGDNYGQTVSNAYHAAQNNIDGVVVQVSRVNGLVDYTVLLEDLHKVSGLPVFLYINPGTALNKEITPDQIRETSELIAGVKVSDKLDNLRKYCKALEGTDTAVYAGNAMDIFNLDDLNIEGVVTGPANVFPEAWVKAWQTKNPEEQKELYGLFKQFREVYHNIPSGRNPIAAFKYVLAENGILESSRCIKNNLDEKDKEYLSKSLDLIMI